MKAKNSWALPLAAFALCVVSCNSPFHRADLESFVETGLANVAMRSLVFNEGFSTNRIPSGQTITSNLVFVNPKSFAVTYSLAWNVDDSFFTVLPPAAPVPSDPTHLSFSFALDPQRAEHKSIALTLGIYIPAINKTFPNQTLSIICDSPPNAPTRAATMMDSSQKSILAFLLPTETSDDDLDKVRISWSQEGTSATAAATYDISALSGAPTADPFSSKYDCYFQSAACEAGYGYSYAIVLIDGGGQESEAITATSTANTFHLNYDGNGNTSGTAPASVGYRYNAVATIASPADLARTSYAFYKWNTARDGSGASYSPGDALTIPAGETTLFAIWITNTTTITFDLGMQALTFSSSSATVSQGSALSVSCSSPALAASGSGWKWYIDGILASSSGPSFSWSTTGADIGQHIVSCAVLYGGVGYSGSFRATVSQ